MTDYASQSKSRKSNPVDLNFSSTHQHIYTALSRGTSAEGTIILQGFDEKKIIGGASGALRQEFRELELLDYITLKQYEGKLPSDITTGLRTSIILNFFEYMGEEFQPKLLHNAIRWNKTDPFDLAKGFDQPWKVIDNSEKTQGKRKRSANDEEDLNKKMVNNQDENPIPKKQKMTFSSDKSTAVTASKKTNASNQKSVSPSNDFIPQGTQWNANSCAYDAVITILYNLWKTNPVYWSYSLQTYGNPYFLMLSNEFNKVLDNKKSLSNIRDAFRQLFVRNDVH
ncbi:hypothetical protein AX16_007404 [Volvariella volvacea WC 439]|nr:hypothetical protein AX16_007404 [Volvariella volvacea WC 439]